MSPSNSGLPALPNEVWVDILRHLPLDTLWYSTRPVCTLFFHVSSSLVKAFLVDGSSCELRHYISFRDPLLSESLYCPLEPTEYQRRILEQEGHSPFSQILLWASPFTSPANPQNGPGIPTVNYESADGKKCVTMAVFGQQQQQTSSSSRGSNNSVFHCRRTGCTVAEEESASDGHVCLAGCWHVHYSRVDKTFCATIPLAILFPIYLRLVFARKEKSTGWAAYAMERKGRWSVGGSRHGVSASVSPLTEIGDMMEDILGANQEETVNEEDDQQGTLMELSEEENEDLYLNNLVNEAGQME